MFLKKTKLLESNDFGRVLVFIWEIKNHNFCPSHLQRKGKDKALKSSENAKKMLFTMFYTQDWKSCQSSSCLRQVPFVNYCINKFTAFLGPCQCITETIKFLLSCITNSCFRIMFSPQNLTFATKNKLSLSFNDSNVLSVLLIACIS